MRNGESQNSCPYCKRGNTDERLRNDQTLTPAQRELLEFTDALDGPALVQSLKLLHDVALYHSHGILDEPEKNALYATKQLWELIAAIAHNQ